MWCNINVLWELLYVIIKLVVKGRVSTSMLFYILVDFAIMMIVFTHTTVGPQTTPTSEEHKC